MTTIDAGPQTSVVLAGLAAVGATLDGLAGVPVWMSDAATVERELEEALRARDRVEELLGRLVGSVIERDLAALLGASSTRSWLMGRYRVSVGEASRLVAGATATDTRSAATRQAWAAGALSREQAVTVGGVVDRLGLDVAADTVDRLQVELVGQAQVLNFAQFQVLCRHAVAVVDPAAADARLAELLEADEHRALQLTQLRISRIGDGTSRLTGRLPDLQAAMLKKALEALASPRRPAGPDGTADSNRDGAGIGTADTAADRDDGARVGYPQRLGRAFAELIEHLPVDELPQHGGGNATVVVSIGLDQLRSGLGAALLDTGEAISAGQARRLACTAQLVPMVLDADSAILDVGLAKRLFDRYQRLALAVHDGGCVWPGCDRPPAYCDAHHIDPWGQGGPTDLANGCLLCPFHHHLLHKGEWSVVMATDGIPDIIPPPRIDPTQRPLRNQRFKPRPPPDG